MNTPEVARGKLLSVQPVLMSSDVRRSISFFEALGFSLAFADNHQEPKYVGLRRDGVELHVQWNELPDEANDFDRPVYRFLVADVDALYQELLARSPSLLSTPGVSPWHAPADTPWGTREFHFRDPSANGLQFYQRATGQS